LKLDNQSFLFVFHIPNAIALHIKGILSCVGTKIAIIQRTQGIKVPHEFVIKEILNNGKRVAKKYILKNKCKSSDNIGNYNIIDNIRLFKHIA